VLVTGASTGIGRACADHLAEIGFEVWAGARRACDVVASRSASGGMIKPLLLDVTEPASIAAAAQTLGESLSEQGLAGLVNNAGIAVSSPLEFVPLELLRRQLEVNVIGQVAVLQAALPLLRQARGRIVNMSSVSGLNAMPFLGPYACSKFALEALTDSLRLELRRWAISVSIVEPGVIATPIWDKARRRRQELDDKTPPEAATLYGDGLRAMARVARKAVETATPPSEVARVVAHALTASRPRTRYLVGAGSRWSWLFSKLPDRLRDLLVAHRLRLS